MKPIIKIGDSFSVPVQFHDTDTGQGMALTADMIISCQIVNAIGQVIATPSITKLDQTTNIGMLLLEVSPTVTHSWKAGSAHLDIKLEVAGNIRHSQNFQFQIERSITL